MKIGDRVVHTDGGVGHIEEIDNDSRWPNANVRWLTPDNVPSCCCGTCSLDCLTVVGENVLPQPRSKAWKRKSKEFYDHVVGAINAASTGRKA